MRYDNPGWYITENVSSTYFDVPPGDGYYVMPMMMFVIVMEQAICYSQNPHSLPNAYINLSFSRFFTGNYGQKLHVLV